MPVLWASLMQTWVYEWLDGFCLSATCLQARLRPCRLMHGLQLIKLSTAGNRQEVPVPCIAYDAMDTCQQTQQVESSCKLFVVPGSDVRRRQKTLKRECRSRDNFEISNRRRRRR
ncbi:hypothetical protein H112_00712 [Trichophyton rubrum D6]|uniref:Uncharacterized protein n=1 Tax=Trichophyton rubrum CBS 288.86 TaxID=1215330 RepID=A0A022WEZ4_TRIRU|nr:hypothetical protein H100_00713 [Trichophyton rubrum MR850]EZF46351.1 hypothetical protein H102_00702 [Trichophyton rubrum CBS 100081]EZF56975.1 hypothetical protein H103_00710 [Trichophyton rubrum CBS 288.86]EZF67604.1 hypothetical protein H104_00697 [Trichophyton rubrum CBS 289.86]EZF88895.1 hypothetical protein H110_00713 [Trichophyton rubrum MR1448]EZF99723.1 hypothetical protein H113_00712 [Trichophyton rubrum MR1459]EZG21292.1 hypothetical protein H107_00760 [Trichophyton rubrum CBS 